MLHLKAIATFWKRAPAHFRTPKRAPRHLVCGRMVHKACSLSGLLIHFLYLR